MVSNLYSFEIFTQLNKLSSDFSDLFFASISGLGQWPVTYLLVALIFWCVDKRAGQLMAFSLSYSGSITQYLKRLFEIERPYIRDDRIGLMDHTVVSDEYSFPSAHTTGTISSWGILALTALLERSSKRISGFLSAIGYVIVILLIAVSRIYSGATGLLDVIGSFLLGLIIILVSKKTIQWVENEDIIRSKRDVIVCVISCMIIVLIMISSGFTADAGAGLGFLSGWLLERRLVHYEIKGSFIERFVRFVIGVGVLLFIYYPVSRLAGGSSYAVHIIFVLRLFAGLYITFLYPLVVQKIATKISDGFWDRLGKVCLITSYILFPILTYFVITIGPLSRWYRDTFGVSFEEIIYTIIGPMQGADTGFLEDVYRILIRNGIILLIVMVSIVCAQLLIHKMDISRGTGGVAISALNRFAAVIAVIMLFILFVQLRYADQELCISDYVSDRIHETTIYEERYIDPEQVYITVDNPKNLLIIYVESLETTYASVADGGKQPKNNYIPGLTRLATENTNFSNTPGLGGWHAVNGTTWTYSALFSTTLGIPFSFPVQGNEAGDDCAAGVVGLGNILEANEYRQMFLCGSDADFAGRAAFFRNHGDYEIYDYFSAESDRYFDKGRVVWWGFEDKYLYEIAKDRLNDLYESGDRFNLTMLTVDTHHVSGYVCDLCDDEYPDQLANVVVCADRQLCDFIDWCKEQPFYEDTVIVIMGDHPRMDKDLVEEVDDYDRTVYDAFINVDEDIVANAHIKKREFDSMDMFPTILAAAGFKIEGDRLGLGTNLFSDLPTLMEEMGYDALDDELSKYSSYYVEKFR
ncbi:Phosphoglycerol transferase MdoB [Lachnospiraceae bacterium XBB2008]|nr:Phosphoglycerol transferase MdoB [Lachnospiraceae bacterium XBB2008]